jgi:hypothetical protein
MDWIYLAQEMERWRAVVSKVDKMWGISCLGDVLIASQQCYCCMEFVTRKSSGLTSVIIKCYSVSLIWTYSQS